MAPDRLRHRLRAKLVAPLGIIALAALLPGPLADAGPEGPKPTVVLVHGAWADSSGWNGVIEQLQQKGYPVIAPANPLRSVAGDADYLASVLATIPWPVVLVGHSYGGCVATNAAAGKPNVKALVFIAAFAPDEGESVFELSSKYPGSKLPTALIARPYLDGGGAAGVDVYIDPARFHDAFIGDVSEATAAVMAAAQRPLTVAAGNDKTTAVAWKTIPSWYLVAQKDNAIPPDAERFMAKRAGSHTVEVSHAVMVAHPDPVTDLIVTAAEAVASTP